jgi:DNA-directed RNA polymerase subunit beta
MVKVYVAIKRKLQVGDKMAGRHGNKGVISRILPEEDMPYLEDGTPVDIVLNPLGVPEPHERRPDPRDPPRLGRHELGSSSDRCSMQTKYPDELRTQLKKIYETTRRRFIDGASDDEDVTRFAEKLRRGVHMATPVFDGASRPTSRRARARGPARPPGQTILFDGRTGEAFEEDVTVGIMYMLKLHHLVDDKIHARSSARTRSSPSSPWAARPSSAASASARWRSGRWRPTAPPTRCRSSSR